MTTRPEHRVAQELQALVGGQAAVLVREGPVGQREDEQVTGQRRRPSASSSQRAACSACACAPDGVRPPRAPGPGNSAQTERTWRPSYWPQVGHAWCGGLSSPQARFGHGDERGGGGLPLRAAGTGVGAGHLPLRDSHGQFSSGVGASPGVPGEEANRVRSRPAHRASTTSWEWSAGRSSSRWPQSTHSPRAVGAAHRCERQAEDDGVTDQRLEIEVVALDAAHLVLLAGLDGRAALVGVELLDVELQGVGERLEAARARPLDGDVELAADEHALHHRLQPEPQRDLGTLGNADHLHPPARPGPVPCA